MTKHHLDSLLKPGSIALMGASSKPGSPGNVLANNVINSEFKGQIYPVNPGYESILNTPCYPDLQSLPETAEHVVFAVSNIRLESALVSAIEHGALAGTIYANCVLEDDREPSLKQRITAIAKEAGFSICGGNSMGYYNVSNNLYAGVYPFPGSVPQGSISLIAQSGSAFSAFAHNGSRLRFNLCVSSGDEIVTTVADYMSWSLAQDNTKVIGIFLESVRDPEGFVNALHLAAQKRIPVVVLKVGKSPLGAALAHTHTGAIAGDHAAYEAVFKKYGVIEVKCLNEMAATLMLFQSGRTGTPGKLAAMHESGGFREMIADNAYELGIEFADISEQTRAEIQNNLEPGLIAENPLDAWGTLDNFENRFCACLSALMKDESVGLGLLVTNFKDNYFLTEALYRNIEVVSQQIDKPLAMVNCFSDLANEDMCLRSSELGVPLIDGSRDAMIASKHLFDFRDFEFEPNALSDSSNVAEEIVEKWRNRLATMPGQTLSETESLALLSDFNIPVPGHAIVQNVDELQKAADDIGYPVALKTSATGIHHKTDHDGVFLNLTSETELLTHYYDMSARLGTSALVSGMAQSGTEVGLGIINDVSFGPFVMVAAGGIFIELLEDRAVSMAPVSRTEADKMISSLRIDTLIRGTRGRPAQDRLGLIKIIVSLSNLAVYLKEHIREIDVNPVIVNENNAIVVDALILLR